MPSEHKNLDKDAALKALENLRMRLLDLTARNRLINLRHTKNASLRIIDELPEQLVDTLLAEKEMRFLPVPEPTRDELIVAGYIKVDEETDQDLNIRKDPTAEEWAKYLGLSTSYEVPGPSDVAPDDKHADTTIQTLLYPYEMEARLKGLLQKAESAIEEMGANILYLAFGFLEWFDTNNENARIAPLFLIPVRLKKGQLNRQTKTYEYRLSYSGEDIIPNLSLREKLRADFAMALPDLDENTTPEAYFRDVQSLIKDNQPRWRLRRFITMALLNFSKLLMYLDLDPTRWPDSASIIDHRVVKQFLAKYEVSKEDPGSGGNFGFGEEHLIDEMENIHEKYPLIDDADSSQHSALIDAVDGKDLVIEGPPGTGKSQTIANLIAAAMSQGKKVLFVAEKLAALEVVRRRLDAVGLGEFCLELHSHKSQKRKVLDEVEYRIKKHGNYRLPQDIGVDIARYEELKTELKGHVELINRPWKNTGKTLHEIFMAATRYREVVPLAPDKISPAGYDGDNYDVTTQRRTEDQVQAFRKVYQGVAAQLDGDADLSRHPWCGVRNADLQIFDLDHVTEALISWQDALRHLGEQREPIAQELNCDLTEVPDSLAGISDLLTDLDQLPELEGNELLDRLTVLRGDFLINARRYLKLFESIQSSYIVLGDVIDHEVLQDLSKVDEIVAGSKRLRQLVTPGIELGTLATAVKKLDNISEQLVELDEPLTEIHSAIGDSAASLLKPTEAGLSELATFIELIASLGASHWKQRDELFDNDELDTLLPKFRHEFEQLHALRDQITPAFDPDALPSEHELRELSRIVANGGMFSWFSGPWRTARKQLLGYIASPQVKFSTLQPLLGITTKFAGRRQAFVDNSRYREVLGSQFNGLDTDVTSLEALRSWYRRVRHEYGIGFGKKVPLGNAIIDLPVGLARAVRSLADRGAPMQLRSLIEELKQLKPVFSPVKGLQSQETPLSGKDGLISKLHALITYSLRACGPAASDNSVSTAQLIDRIEKLQALKNTVATWEQAEFDKKVFQGRIGLRAGLNVDNSAGLLAMRNTLGLASIVDEQIVTEEIRDLIYAHPNANTFAKISSLTEQLRASLDAYEQRFSAFKGTVSLDTNGWMRQCSDKIDLLIARNQLALGHADSLQNWLDYVRARDQLEDMGLVKLAEHVEDGEIDIEQIEDAHEASIYDLLAREILREQPELGRFSGRSQEAMQEKFAEYDNRLKRLQCERIAWQVDQHEVPNGNPGPRASDRTGLFLLQHECSKKSRHVPIRQLLRRAGEALASLKPCFMMGPMSVAQYLVPGQIEFDLVVMDEASQIKPQDALGAIGRGAQIVVVGDPKQLPPTSFFDRVVDDDEEDPTGIEESESILDATLPMFPTRRLRWHYRSQHENLIAFSNHSFYDGDLVLFPSPHKGTDNYGIQYSRLNRGCFVNRRNIEEAKVISEAVREHFRHRPEESLGVVAMSAEQRQQIERAIETLTKEDMVFQEWLEKDASHQESLFVKNLENVQGDERDVIFISMTYGPQEPRGKVFQRFGPINSDVGWRRLNVLFTRSKKRMHIFSSMGSDDIVAGATSRRGVQALRDFLSFCETGILHKTERETERGPDSDFEIAVMAALKKEGFECIPQVGVAGFFIDTAVVDPGNPGRYLMGIECDGATYHSAKSVRDRDRLRQAILERLGWRIRRIWSTDWFKNPHAELAPIIRELHELKSFQPTVGEDTVDTEHEEIEEIIGEIEEQESDIGTLLAAGLDLRTALSTFDQEIIRKEFPGTPDGRRLLRPSMLKALIEYTPTSKAEFFEMIPAYIRQATEANEGKYLDHVFEIINASLEEA